MSNLTRYIVAGASHETTMVAMSNGVWVRHSDHEVALERQKASNLFLIDQMRRMHEDLATANTTLDRERGMFASLSTQASRLREQLAAAQADLEHVRKESIALESKRTDALRDVQANADLVVERTKERNAAGAECERLRKIIADTMPSQPMPMGPVVPPQLPDMAYRLQLGHGIYADTAYMDDQTVVIVLRDVKVAMPRALGKITKVV